MVCGFAAAYSRFRSVCEAVLLLSFERLVDLYLNN